MSSILNDTKKQLGIDEASEYFDPVILMNINSVFVTLNQLGVGPDTIFSIEDEEDDWDDFMTDSTVAMVKPYLYMKVRLMFDPPQQQTLLDAMERQVSELEFRLVVTTSK